MACSTNSQNKDSSSHKLSRGGIPLANGDVELQRPPPWAFPLWNQHDAPQNSTDQILRSASQSIDQAMVHLWEAKVKFVHVSLSVDSQNIQNSSKNNEPRVVSRNLVNNDLQKDNEHMTSNNLLVNDLKTETKFGDILGDAGSTHEASNRDRLTDEEWISVTLTTVPGVNMDDLEDQEPTKRKEHCRVPSTIAMAEVNVGL